MNENKLKVVVIKDDYYKKMEEKVHDNRIPENKNGSPVIMFPAWAWVTLCCHLYHLL
jgi:hypothetical protein